jgi:hypothetical protein
MRVFRTLGIISLVAMLLIGSHGCSKSRPRSQSRQTERAGTPFSQLTDDQKLLLFQRFPLGTTPSEVRDATPGLGPQRDEVPMQRLTDAQVETGLLGHRIRAEFNFQGDSLYAVNFGPLILPADSGEALFDTLCTFYARRFGEPFVGDGQDDPYFVKARTWTTGWGEVGISMSVDGKRRILGWGYQSAIHARIQSMTVHRPSPPTPLKSAPGR